LPKETPEMSCDRDMLESIAMKEIPLTQGKVAIVDDEDFEELSKFLWFAHKAGNTFYAVRNSSSIRGKRHMISMHSTILKTSKGMDTDHFNGNGLDNRRENLRICTHRENMQNQHINKTSNYQGVSWSNRDQMWRAYIWVNGKSHNLGNFNDEIKAAKVYNDACDNPGKIPNPHKKSSNFFGVCWDRSKKRWLSYIHTSGKMRNLGRFNDEITAAIISAMARNAVKMGAVL
jgi:hypothetical protein